MILMLCQQHCTVGYQSLNSNIRRSMQENLLVDCAPWGISVSPETDIFHLKEMSHLVTRQVFLKQKPGYSPSEASTLRLCYYFWGQCRGLVGLTKIYKVLEQSRKKLVISVYDIFVPCHPWSEHQMPSTVVSEIKSDAVHLQFACKTHWEGPACSKRWKIFSLFRATVPKFLVWFLNIGGEDTGET